jgi:predicted amidohydrolase|tara:strand:+ start:2144 stop:2920 length:777 start_codon:yes stop_codon:yes gene_type:complete
MKVGFIQTNPEFGRVKENTNNIIEKLKEIDADLIVLPELFNIGYNFKDKEELLNYAETANGETAIALQRVAREKDICIVAGIAEKDENKDIVYNSAIMVTKDKINVYRKTHLFDNEKKIFEPGNTGFNVFGYKNAKIGMMICFDWVFPEAARTLALKNCDIIAHPANLVLSYCPETMKTRAIENGVFTITCNRFGKEKGLDFIGMSQITDTKGNILYRASEDKEEIKVVEINIEEARSKSMTKNNHLFEDRRTEMYEL